MTETSRERAFRFVVRVRYADTDQMGMAYHGNYLRWFEAGRTEMLRALGMSYREVEAAGIRLPVLEARCRYVRPARYDDQLAIDTVLSRVGRASLTFEYRVTREGTDELLARGMTEHCFLDPAGRPVRPPAFFVALLARVSRS